MVRALSYRGHLSAFTRNPKIYLLSEQLPKLYILTRKAVILDKIQSMIIYRWRNSM
jgi:hypothetical protein